MFGVFHPNYESEYIIDTKRGVVVNTRNMTADQKIIYQRNYFNCYRPDLSELERYIWVELNEIKQKIGERLLAHMKMRLNKETERVRNLYSSGTKVERIKPFYDQFIQLNSPYVQFFRPSANRDWEDASKLVNYVESKIFKIQKYGTYAQTKILGKEAAVELENQLTERFIREMRKPPYVKAEATE